MMLLACYTQQEIADELGVKDKSTISRFVEESCNLESFPKSNKLLALYQEPGWEPPPAGRRQSRWHERSGVGQ